MISIVKGKTEISLSLQERSKWALRDCSSEDRSRSPERLRSSFQFSRLLFKPAAFGPFSFSLWASIDHATRHPFAVF
jgi:hypothetical protein